MAPRTPQPTPRTNNPFQVATMPTVAQLQPDLVDQHYEGGSIPTMRITPVMPSGNPNIVSAAKSVVEQMNAGSGPPIDVNGVPVANPNFSSGGNVTFSVNGNVVSATAASGGTSFGTAGLGWFLGGQSYSAVQGAGGGGQIHSNNVVGAVMLIVESTWVISRLSAFTVTGNGSGGYLTAALYSADGNTKLIDAGLNFLDMSTHSQHLGTVVISPSVTVSPGVYWFAWGSYDASNGGSVFIHQDTPGMAGLLNNWSFPWPTTVPPVRFGTAANPIVAGIMPNSLGVITPFAFAAETFVPVVAFIV